MLECLGTLLPISIRMPDVLNAQPAQRFEEASAPSQHRDDCRRKESKRVSRRNRVAVAGVRAPRVAMVLAVTRGAAALRRCARGSAVRGGSLHIFVSVISPSILARSPSNLRYPLAFSRLNARTRRITLVLRLTCINIHPCDGLCVLSRKRTYAVKRDDSCELFLRQEFREEFCSRRINYFHRLCQRYILISPKPRSDKVSRRRSMRLSSRPRFCGTNAESDGRENQRSDDAKGEPATHATFGRIPTRVAVRYDGRISGIRGLQYRIQLLCRAQRANMSGAERASRASVCRAGPPAHTSRYWGSTCPRSPIGCARTGEHRRKQGHARVREKLWGRTPGAGEMW